MRSFVSTVICAFVLGLGVTNTFADDTTSPSTASTAASQPGTNGAMPVFITAVSGLVQVRAADDQAWQAATVNMQISQGAELRTGPHSSVTCVIPPDQTFTLDRLGTVRVEEAIRDGNKITTNLMMKYGRTHYDIEGAGLEHEASITSPSSTLAVRGTNVSLFDQPPFQVEAISYTGRAQFTYKHSTIPVGKKHGSFAKAAAGSDGASETAVSETVVDPQYAAALTAADQQLIATQVARGAVISFNAIAGIPTVSGGRPSYDSELPSSLPGDLDFVLRWTGDVNLNIEVGVDPGNPLANIAAGFQESEFLYPGYGLQNSPSGGHIPYDDLGGPNGGEEIAYWLGPYPTGLYGIEAQNMSNGTTSFTYDVYANGVPQEMYFTDNFGNPYKSTQITRTLGPYQLDSTAPIVLIPSSPLLESLTPDDPLGNPNPGINPPANTSVQVASARAAAPKALPTVQAPARPVEATPAIKPVIFKPGGFP